MSPEDRQEAVGMTGLAIGGILENIALGGMAVLAIAAVAVAAAPAGLTAGAFFSLGALGTALAGVGIFGKGMADKGDELSGNIVSQAKELRRGFVKALLRDLVGAKPPAPVFAPDARPVSKEFSAAVTPDANAASVAAVSATPPVSAPEMK